MKLAQRSSRRGSAIVLIALLLLLPGCAILTPSADRQPPTAPESLQFSCATPAVVGLRWTAATDNLKVAGYRISRGGTVIGTTGKEFFSDTSVQASTAYTYVVTAFDAAGNTAASDPLTVTTAVASPNGDAPYCQSAVISSMSWNWWSGYTQANGSDLWPVAWGNDGNVYAFFGDGGGFGGDNNRGRTSFGITKITGEPPPTSDSATNVYGGYNAQHPAAINGKASSILALGNDFYAIGGLYRPTDTATDYPNQPSGSPNHVEIAYSIGNAYSWQESPWSFCSIERDSAGSAARSFCPSGFVSFGKGNAGALDNYVYIFGIAAASYWDTGHKIPPAHTYLARVRNDQILTQSAYEYFAGLSTDGAPNWSSSTDRMLPVFTDRNINQTGCNNDVCTMASTLEEAVYIPALKRYVGIAQGEYAAQTSFYDAPSPWGPWTVISYNNINAATGSGGWGNLGTAAGGSLGAHIVNAWSASTGQTIWVTYSSDGTAPPGALFPSATTAMDSFNLVSANLNVTTTR